MKPSLMVTAAHKPDIEPVLPLINVVFLLLIFFLMTGKLVKPQQAHIQAPQQIRTVDDIKAESDEWLYVDQHGELTYRQSAVSHPCEHELQQHSPLVIFADAQITGKTLNVLLGKLAKCNITDIAVITERTSQ